MILYMVLCKREEAQSLSQFEKLLLRIRNNPKAVKFEELKKILTKYGYECT